MVTGISGGSECPVLPVSCFCKRFSGGPCHVSRWTAVWTCLESTIDKTSHFDDPLITPVAVYGSFPALATACKELEPLEANWTIQPIDG